MDNDEYRITQCVNCGTKNQIPEHRIKDNPRCGKCGAFLLIETQQAVLVGNTTARGLFFSFLNWPLWLKISILASLLWCFGWYIVAVSDHYFNKVFFASSFIPVIFYWGIIWIFQNTTKKFKQITTWSMIACAIIAVIIAFYNYYA